MQIKNIATQTQKPGIYEKGTAVMWTDEYISKQLLQVHLNEDVDLASRKKETVIKTCNWILSQTSGKKMTILDLGCGPGLYTELMAEEGHEVTGVDFSRMSINHARESAQKKGLSIEYIQANYLELEMEENTFDLVILIFTDLGVLLPEEREKMVRFVLRVLKPGGTFIFDVLNDKDLEQKVAPRNWEVAEQGFWKPFPYIALSESFLYEQEKVILYQHILIDEDENTDVYRFWTHFFSHRDIEELLRKNGFWNFEHYENVLPAGDLFSGENVTFCVARK